MKKGLSLLVALALALLALPALAEGTKTVNVLSWEGYVDEDTIQAFENETGIDVVWSPMDSIDDMLLKVTQSGGEGYDLILTSDYSLDILRQAGLLQELDKSLLPNYENLNPLYLNQYFDPDNQYVIPYVAGCPLIVYDPERVPFEITGYEDLWNESLTDSVACLEQYRVLIGVTLKTLGYSMNETDPDILAKAREKLMPLYKNIRTFGDMEAYAAMQSGEASVGFLFTPFASLLMQEFPQYKLVYPKEGLGFGIDGFVLTAASQNVESAHAFLNYLMDAKVAAHDAEYQAYMCFNKAAEAELSADYWANPAYNPPEEMLKNAEYVMNIGDAESLYADIYAAFKLQ